jgi:hypothetical protein
MSTLIGVVLLGSLGRAQEPAAVYSGIVSDSECGLDHARMKKQHNLANDRVCTRECCEKYKQEYVLADHVSGEVYQIDDQKSVRRFANRHVRILGSLDPTSGTIRLQRVEAVR